MDGCEHCFITNSYCSIDNKVFKLAFCLSSECEFPARYCAVHHQEEHTNESKTRYSLTGVR